MLGGWGLIFGGLFFSHFLSSLPDVRNLMVSGPSQDVTILDDRGRLIARRGLTQGPMVRAEDLPDYVPTPSSPSKTAASARISASIPSAWRARRCRT